MNESLLKSDFSLLNTDHVQLGREWDYKNVTSTFIRMYLIDEGHGILSTPEASSTLEKGFLYLIPSFTTCSYHCPVYLSQYYLSILEESTDGISLFANNRKVMKVPAVEQDLASFKRILALNPNRHLRASHDPKVYEKTKVLQSFRELNNRTSLPAYMETNGILLQLLSRFVGPENFRIDKPVTAIPSKVLDAINFIQTHLTKDLTVSQLAKRANQNSDYFARQFKTVTGETPVNYIQSVRMERAQFLLITTNLTLTEIANATGYKDISYFSRVFSRKIGQTPGEYRKNNRMI